MATDELRLARYKLEQALEEGGLDAAYAEAICKRQYRCSVAQASTQQVWRRFFTIRNRAKAKAAKAVEAADAPF